MTEQNVSPSPRPDSRRASVDALIDRLRGHYPDMSRFTVVAMTGRGRDFLHHLIHTRIGGLLPTICSFDEYRTRRIADATGRAAVAEVETLVRFQALRCREAGITHSPADTQRLLAFLTTIADFSVGIQELRALDRIGPEQLGRIDRFFATVKAFRTRLADEGLLYPPFETEVFAGLAPGDGDLFVGLPLMTPVNERFFRRIRHDRLFVDAPAFGPHMPSDPPGYETALSLIRRIGIAERRSSGEEIAFSELDERKALPALIACEIDDFLRQAPGQGQQLFVVPLDERLSFYLWELCFRPLGGQVNFAPWIPFGHFAAAHRLRDSVRRGAALPVLRRELVAELASRWNDMEEADRSAFEAAIILCDELERLRPIMDGQWPSIAEHLISAKKLRLRGNRSAPIQVVGLGDATGVPYHRAVVLPVNSGIFPQKPFNGPYLNWIHLPRIHRARFEADDLALRQFLSFGRSAHLAALYDQARGDAPSPHFSFLVTEFGRKPVKRRMGPTPFRSPEGPAPIENTDEIKGQLRRHVWSYSSLGLFFTCPFRFILEEIQAVTPPPLFEGEEHANLLIGNFLHRLFAELRDCRPIARRWRERFEARWEGDAELKANLPGHAVHKAIVLSYLADIAQWEQETGRSVLFTDEVAAVELDLVAPFGDGRYGLKGRIDRLQRSEGKLCIADLKYKEKQDPKGRLADRVARSDGFDERFQLLIYAYLAVQCGTAAPDRLEARYVFLRPTVRGDYEGRLAEEELAHCDATMALIAQRLDGMLDAERFAPNYRTGGCAYCPHKALCLRPDLYRSGGRPW